MSTPRYSGTRRVGKTYCREPDEPDVQQVMLNVGTRRLVSEVGCRETIYSFSRWRHNPTTQLQLTSQIKLTLNLTLTLPNPKKDRPWAEPRHLGHKA